MRERIGEQREDPPLTQVVLTCLLPSAFCFSDALENHNAWAVASLAVDDEGQFDDAGALQLGNEDDVDVVEPGDQTFASGKFHGQEVDVSILSMRLDRDGLGDIRDHHPA